MNTPNGPSTILLLLLPASRINRKVKIIDCVRKQSSRRNSVFIMSVAEADHDAIAGANAAGGKNHSMMYEPEEEDEVSAAIRSAEF
jgi:hypothetical protein